MKREKIFNTQPKYDKYREPSPDFEFLEPRILLTVTWPAAPFPASEIYVNQNGDAFLDGTNWPSIDYAGDHDPWKLFFNTSGQLTIQTTGITNTEMAFYDHPNNPSITDDNSGDGFNAKIESSIESLESYLIDIAGYNEITIGDYGLDINGPFKNSTNIPISGSNPPTGSDSKYLGYAFDFDFYYFSPTTTGQWSITVDPTSSWDVTFNVFNNSGNPIGGTFTSSINSGLPEYPISHFSITSFF